MTMIPIQFDVTLFAVLAFFAALVACVAGLFYSGYRDNWLQAIGMAAVGLASALKIQQIYQRDYSTPETALLGLGIALFALGVAWKVWLNQRSIQRPRKQYRGPERRRQQNDRARKAG